jgi:hypothetical protein
MSLPASVVCVVERTTIFYFLIFHISWVLQNKINFVTDFRGKNQPKKKKKKGWRWLPVTPHGRGVAVQTHLSSLISSKHAYPKRLYQ